MNVTLQYENVSNHVNTVNNTDLLTFEHFTRFGVVYLTSYAQSTPHIDVSHTDHDRKSFLRPLVPCFRPGDDYAKGKRNFLVARSFLHLQVVLSGSTFLKQ